MTVNMPTEEEPMADDTELKISDPDNVPVTFCNDIASSGYANSVVNLTLITARFTPTGTTAADIGADLVIASRLRMDMHCAYRLWQQLDEILKTHRPPTTGESVN
jgi:hypothetical protein